MKNFFLNDSFGQIKSAGTCADNDFAYQVQPGLVLREGQARPADDYWNGEAVVPKPLQPSPNHVFNWPTLEWLDPRTLNDLKAEKNIQINRMRMFANRRYFTHGGKRIACDSLSRDDIDGVNGSASLNSALPAGFPGAWKAMDNSYIAIPNLDAWKAFYGSMVSAGTANFGIAQQLKNQLASATTIEAVEAISWPIA